MGDFFGTHGNGKGEGKGGYEEFSHVAILRHGTRHTKKKPTGPPMKTVN
jgi:hypothetical protein